MPRAQHTVTIQRQPETVFAYVVDGEKCPDWRSHILDIRRVSGDGGVGTRYSQAVQGPMGRRIAADYEVTVCEPNRRYEFQTVTGPARPHGRFDFEETDGGTRLSLALDAKMGGLVGLLLGGMVQKTMDTEVQAIERLKDIVESSMPPSTAPQSTGD